MQATATATFDLTDFDKGNLITLARECGLRRDWARVKTAEIRAMLLAVSYDRLRRALKAGDLTDEQIDALRIDACDFKAATADDAEDDALGADELADYLEGDDGAALPEAAIPPVALPVTAAVNSYPAPAVAPASKPAPDVSKLAGLLAQILATGAVDSEQVEKIVGEKLTAYTSETDQRLLRFGGQLLAEQRVLRESLVAEMARQLAAMPAREIVIKSEKASVTLSGLQHHKFETLLKACAARNADGHRLNVYLYGPPGTGKTTAARSVAKALDLAFHCNGAVSTKYELTGFIDANGTCHNPEFRKAWQHGGVYLFDEIDGSVSAAVVAFNAALANGVMAFPDGMLERHPDCVVIAAGNTVHGATADFTGRTKLDAASLDRFLMIEWGIDEKLEEAMAGGFTDWIANVRRVRGIVAAKGIKVMVTPRATSYGAALLAAGMNKKEVFEVVLRKGMNDQQWAMVA